MHGNELAPVLRLPRHVRAGSNWNRLMVSEAEGTFRYEYKIPVEGTQRIFTAWRAKRP